MISQLLVGIALAFLSASTIATSITVYTDFDNIQMLDAAVEEFKSDTGYYPSTAEGLSVLVDPAGIKNARSEGYLKSLPNNRWGYEFQYGYPGTHNQNRFDIWTLGRDGLPGGIDMDRDCGNWQDGFDSCPQEKALPPSRGLMDALPMTVVFGSVFSGVLYLLIALVRKVLGTQRPKYFKGKTVWISLFFLPLFIAIALPLMIEGPM